MRSSRRLRCLVVSAVLFLWSAHGAEAFERVKFAVLSDPHIALPEQKGVKDGFKLGTKTALLARLAVADINKIPGLDFVLVAGDLTQDAEPWNLDTARTILDALTVPYYVVLGNHDVSPVPSEAKDQPITLSKYVFTAAFVGEHGGMSPGHTYYAREVAPGLVVVALDTTRPPVYLAEAGMNDFGGGIDPGQMRWLEKTLRANRDKAVIVLTHHSAVPWHDAEKGKDHHQWRAFWMDNGEEVARMLGSHNVRAVLSGHRHISTRHKRVHGVHHVINPATSTYPMRYVVYEMTPTELTWQTRDVAAPREVWKLARANFLADDWWRGPDHPKTPEGDRRYLRFYESPATMKGRVLLAPRAAAPSR